MILKLPEFINELNDYEASLLLFDLAKLINSTPEECLQIAYDRISKRKTTMVNGVAVKE